jgi:GNAT superfamily N-acetyltransferase
MDARQRSAVLYINGLIGQLSGLFGDAYSEVIRLKEVRAAIESGEPFTFAGNPTAERKLNDVLNSLSGKTENLIRNGITGGWKLGESEVKDTLLNRFGKKEYGTEVNATLEQAVKDHRAKGMTAHRFANQKRGGLNVSDRVWNLMGNAGKEIESLVQYGIKEGVSADSLSRNITKYLNEPDRWYRQFKKGKNSADGSPSTERVWKRRVFDESTQKYKWVDSNPSDYHPGRGVYRSSYKNAMRLAITEINAAYRRAEWESYQQNPLIKGYRIELSSNHTTLIKGVPRPLHDICDELKGEYPKSFLWEGWHPHCRCRMIPITVTRQEMKDRMTARRDGKLDEWKPENEVKKVPDAFTEWVETNKKRIQSAKKLPYWITDNYTGGNISKGLKETLIRPVGDHGQPEPAKREEEGEVNRPFVMDAKNAETLKRNGFTAEAFKIKEFTFDDDFDVEYNKSELAGFDMLAFNKEITDIFSRVGVNITLRHIGIYKGSKATFRFEGDYNGEEVILNRSFRIEKGIKSVHHDLFVLPEALQGKGISKKVFQSLYKQYKNAGVQKIDVYANLNIGGYTWARYGFTANKEEYFPIIYSAKRRVKYDWINQEEYDDFYNWINQFKGKEIPFYEIAGQKPYMKELMKGSDWNGYMDFKNPEQKKVFEEYLKKH